MGTGPSAKSGYDLALTELLDGEHTFLARVGSDRGAGVLDQLQTVPATERHGSSRTSRRLHDPHMGRTMDTTDIRNLLYDNPEHPVGTMASRCLSCGNCTMVCPTCFCTSVEDHTSLSGEHTERWRVWDCAASPPTSPTCTVAASAAAGSPATGSG